jgi:hypothetical protein
MCGRRSGDDDVFEEHRIKKAASEHAEAFAAWQADRSAQATMLDTAKHYEGVGSDALMLKPGEAIFFTVTGASLVEDRRGAGHYAGRSQGISVPVGSIGGRTVRYRVGASKGHYVEGAPSPTAIDTGSVFVTNQRVIFQGGKQTRECAYEKLIGTEHDDAGGTTTFSVSNRQKPTTIHYGPGVAGAFDFGLDLALAHYKGTVGAMVAELEQGLAEIDRHRPPDPADMSAPAPAPEPAPTAPPPEPAASSGWYADRWWDGSVWTDQVHGDAVGPGAGSQQTVSDDQRRTGPAGPEGQFPKFQLPPSS